MDAILKQKKQDLIDFKRNFGLRDDWHEPDEQDISARVTGLYFDNACGDDPSTNDNELTVVLYKDDHCRVFAINLATLLAIASSE